MLDWIMAKTAAVVVLAVVVVAEVLVREQAKTCRNLPLFGSLTIR